MQINIEKRHAIMIFAGLLLLAGSFYVYAYAVAPGAVPNPGHPIASIQGLFSGDSDLNQTLSTKFCQADGTNCPAPVSVSWDDLTGKVPLGFMRGYCLVNNNFCISSESIEPCYCSGNYERDLKCRSGYKPILLMGEISSVHYYSCMRLS